MYTSQFGLSKKPFSLTPDPDFLYLSPLHKKALTVLEYGLMSQAEFTVITGSIGSGKTTLTRYVLNDMGEEYVVGLITNTHHSFSDLLTWVLAAFNIEEKGGDKAERYKLLVDFLKKIHSSQRRAVLVVDEAQNMGLDTLEELRLLTNLNNGSEVMLQLVLSGHPELAEKLKSPELVQFAQRISIEIHLTSLSYEETVKYIHHRLKVAGSERELFTKGACLAVYYFTGGVPRLINNICELSLVFAFADDEELVTLHTVVDVIKENKTGGIVPLVAEENEENEKIRHIVLENQGIDLAEL